ncbi:uncharacterized protein [Prorops nasuta]|uniref:uncharacterized protein n=1 Tax=Prorops nasuta TaxID=863751 RepID=UPI0034CF17B8
MRITLGIIRQKFWLMDSRNQVQNANLPEVRINEAFPFANTGIDYCGPLFTKEKKFRNRGSVKVYICVFVCMVVKAIHLEVVTDLSSDGFLAALRRFIARRGLPSNIYSDNGSNFVGANNKLKELYLLLNSEDHKKKVHNFFSENCIKWHFIPPISPHFVGLWESSVKLFKHHFRRVVGDTLFTLEELQTFTVEVEGILNSRSIIPLSADPNDMLALTPAHYLIGRPITTLPSENVSCVPANRLSNGQHICTVRQDFWARWNLEYIHELQKRQKLLKDGTDIKEGTLVIIKEKNQPCSHWSMGKIIKTHPGRDGMTRVVTLKTTRGDVQRPVKLICPLPINQ